MRESRPGRVWLLAPVIMATAILLLFTWLVEQAAAKTPAELALVRVEIHTPEGLLVFTRLEIPIYDHASGVNRDEYLLTALDPYQQARQPVLPHYSPQTGGFGAGERVC